MRLALVGPLPPPSGGMANQTLQLQRLLEQMGVATEIVQVNRPYRPTWVGRVKGLRALARLLPYFFALWKALRRADVAHVMANSGWSWHLFAMPAIWIGRFCGTPVVVNYRGGYAGDFLDKHARLVRFSMRRASRLIVPSGFLKAIFAEHGMHADIVPNVVDTDQFSPSNSRDSDTPIILVTRNLEPIYDNESALRAFAQLRKSLPKVRLVIAGSGPEESRLKALAAELGVANSASFTGRVEAADMPALYQSASISLNPSRVDNMPNSVLEAHAAGVPVVSTRVGGVPYIVEHEKTGLLVEPGAPHDMAAAILRLLTQPKLYAHLRQQGLEAAQQYTWGRIGPGLLKVYEEAISGHSPSTVLSREAKP